MVLTMEEPRPTDLVQCGLCGVYAVRWEMCMRWTLEGKWRCEDCCGCPQDKEENIG